MTAGFAEEGWPEDHQKNEIDFPIFLLGPTMGRKGKQWQACGFISLKGDTPLKLFRPWREFLEPDFLSGFVASPVCVPGAMKGQVVRHVCVFIDMVFILNGRSTNSAGNFGFDVCTMKIFRSDGHMNKNMRAALRRYQQPS